MTTPDSPATAHQRWVPLLLIITYAIFGGLSFPFYHESVQVMLPAGQSQLWLLTCDASYIFLTILLVSMLMLRLVRIIHHYEQALKDSEARFRGLVESCSDVVWEVNERFEYTFVSPSIKPLIGFNQEHVIGKTIFALMESRESLWAKEILQQFATQQQAYHLVELQLVHRDGRVITIESSGTPIFTTTGVFCGFRGIDRNITDRAKAERVLEQSHEFYRTLFEEFPLPIWRSDTNGRIIYCNRAGVHYLGEELDEAVCQLGDIHPDDQEQYFSQYQTARSAQRAFALQYRIRRYDGEYALIEHIGQPCHGADGSFIGYIGYFKDSSGCSHADQLTGRVAP
ncbi:MAG TPA: PAS domain-containing protein [Armatimonadota bacterium]